jgi:subtilisin family serine protease
MFADVREPLVSALRLQAGMSRLDSSLSDTATRIALIDGAIQRNHVTLAGAAIEQTTSADSTEGSAHATFIASILVGRGTGVLGLSPGCTLVSLPVADAQFTQGMLSAPEAASRLAQAVMQALALGVHVIQLSMQFSFELSASFRVLSDALLAASARGVRTVIAAGNQGPAGANAVLRSAGVVPVVSAHLDGTPASTAALGPAVGARGLLAPGINIPGAAIPSGSATRSGSSFAAAFVTGAFALLRCHYPHLSTDAIWDALLSPRPRSRSIAPPALDADASFAMLAPHYRGHA